MKSTFLVFAMLAAILTLRTVKAGKDEPDMFDDDVDGPDVPFDDGLDPPPENKAPTSSGASSSTPDASPAAAPVYTPGRELTVTGKLTCDDKPVVQAYVALYGQIKVDMPKGKFRKLVKIATTKFYRCIGRGQAKGGEFKITTKLGDVVKKQLSDDAQLTMTILHKCFYGKGGRSDETLAWQVTKTNRLTRVNSDPHTLTTGTLNIPKHSGKGIKHPLHTYDDPDHYLHEKCGF